jgi:hypothetical protein
MDAFKIDPVLNIKMFMGDLLTCTPLFAEAPQKPEALEQSLKDQEAGDSKNFYKGLLKEGASTKGGVRRPKKEKFDGIIKPFSQK